MLDLGGIPLRSADRGESDPLVIAGGPTATHPEPLAPFIDAVVVIGDGEERGDRDRARVGGPAQARRPARRAPEARSRSCAACTCRRSTARRVEADTGFTVVDAPLAPEARVPVVAHAGRRSERVPLPRRRPHRRARGHLRPHVDRDRARLHRGLPLLPGRDDLPPRARARPGADRRDAWSAAVKKSGYDEASLTSLSTADYSCIAPLVKKVADALAPERVSLGVSSPARLRPRRERARRHRSASAPPA